MKLAICFRHVYMVHLLSVPVECESTALPYIYTFRNNVDRRRNTNM